MGNRRLLKKFAALSCLAFGPFFFCGSVVSLFVWLNLLSVIWFCALWRWLTAYYCNLLPSRRLVRRPSSNGGRRTDRVVWWFFSGLLEALLGKPGTLHSLGKIVISALGVPPDLRGAPVPGMLLVGPLQG